MKKLLLCSEISCVSLSMTKSSVVPVSSGSMKNFSAPECLSRKREIHKQCSSTRKPGPFTTSTWDQGAGLVRARLSMFVLQL